MDGDASRSSRSRRSPPRPTPSNRLDHPLASTQAHLAAAAAQSRASRVTAATHSSGVGRQNSPFPRDGSFRNAHPTGLATTGRPAA